MVTNWVGGYGRKGRVWGCGTTEVGRVFFEDDEDNVDHDDDGYNGVDCSDDDDRNDNDEDDAEMDKHCDNAGVKQQQQQQQN